MSSKILGSLSPVYGLMSGKGAFGKLADSGLGGIIPTALAQQRRRKRKDGTEMTPEEEAAMAEAGMKKGGKVKSFRDGGIYTADMGQPPQDIDGGSAPPKKTASKKSEAPKRSMTPMDKKNAAYMELQAAKEKEAKGLQLPTGGKAAKMGDKSLSPRSASAKAAAAAYDKVQNMRESEREVAEERLRRASKSEKNSYAKGGSVSKRADGIAERGKTNCKIC